MLRSYWFTINYFSRVRLPIHSWWLMVNKLGLLSLMEARTRGSAWAPSSTPQLTVRKELDWQAIWPIRTWILCATAAIRHLARQLRPVSIETHVKTGKKDNFFNITKYKNVQTVKLCCCNKLRYSFKVLVLCTRKSVMSGAVWLVEIKLNTEC